MYVLIVLILFFVLLGIYAKLPTFLNKNELFKVLSDDKYLNTLSKKDLEVRNVKTKKEYINKNIKKSVSTFTLKEKIRLIKLTYFIDNKIRETKLNSYIDTRKFANISWKFGLVRGNLYENGLSHTRNGVIILSKETMDSYSDRQLTQTLIHEKTHVYQYLYPQHTEKYVKVKKFKKAGLRKGDIRANPDTDEYVYIDKNGKEFSAVYNKNAKSITDSTYSSGNSQIYEHPFESMAIEVENALSH